jgi:cbb3-type cytochrome oxidase subunit 1
MNASTLCFRAAVLLLIAGMIWGLQMAISGDHSAFPAHAHLNLLGFVALFLFGIFYRLNPAVEARRLAVPQVWIWIVSTIVAAVGIGLVHTGHEIGDPIAAVGSLIIFADTLLFAWLVFQVRPAETLAARPIVPAE